jgi:hypothetical protein
MPFLELFDESLDINSTGNYEMSLQVSSDNLSFCLLDSLRNKYILIRSFHPDKSRGFGSEEIAEIMSKDDFLSKKFKKVHIVMPSPKFTLMPAPLYDPARKDEYFTFNHITAESSIILNNKLANPDSFLLFAVSRPLFELIQEFYPSVHPFHHLRVLLDHISRFRQSEAENYIHVHVESDFFNLVIFNNNILQFSNTFIYRNISDILYFILNVFRNMGIKQEERIYLSGQTEMYDELYSNISLYIRDVRFAVPSGSFTFSYVFNDTTLHKYLNLLSVVNCA